MRMGIPVIMLCALLIAPFAAASLFGDWTDTDGGFNLTEKGTVSNGTVSATDYCLDMHRVVEHWLSPMNESGLNYSYMTINCTWNYGYCEYGECVYGNNWCSRADINRNTFVDYEDYKMILIWFGTPCNATSSWCNNADIDKSGMVDYEDYKVILRKFGSTGCTDGLDKQKALDKQKPSDAQKALLKKSR